MSVGRGKGNRSVAGEVGLSRLLYSVHRQIGVTIILQREA
jgi:hypothetical protein